MYRQDENAVLAVLILFMVASFSFGFFILADHVSCRPISVDPATFALSSANYYGMKYIGAGSTLLHERSTGVMSTDRPRFLTFRERVRD
jgi:hypothetical protein